jgi:hypothetical protein
MTRTAKAAAAEKRRVQRLVDSFSFSEDSDTPKEQYDRCTAVHEAAHVIVGYAVGTTTVLNKAVALTVLPTSDGMDGNAQVETKGASPEDIAVISFAGTIAERTAFPNIIQHSYVSDAEDILYEWLCARYPQLGVEFEAIRSLDKESESYKLAYKSIFAAYGNNRLYQATTIVGMLDRLPESARSELLHFIKPYMGAIHALTHFPPEELSTNGCLEYFKDLDDFELLRPIAARSWALVRSNWPAIEALADEIQIRKQMSGKEVHEFVTKLLRVEVTA